MPRRSKMSADESNASASDVHSVPLDDNCSGDESEHDSCSEKGDLTENSSDHYNDSNASDVIDAEYNDRLEQSTSAADDTDQQSPKKKKKVRKLNLTTTTDFNATLSKRGIVYLSRIPPRMGPSKVKSLLSDFGPISRIYLVEEDKTLRKKRRKAGGSGFKRYTEGWVEFESKKVAKLVGETLNMSRVTNHKRSLHYDDLWNVKYLKGFKWSHLTEKVAYERRIREQKLRIEMMEVRRENAAFVAEMEAGKRLDYIEERRKRTGKVDANGPDDDGKKKRKIKQKKTFEGSGKSATEKAILSSLI